MKNQGKFKIICNTKNIKYPKNISYKTDCVGDPNDYMFITQTKDMNMEDLYSNQLTSILQEEIDNFLSSHRQERNYIQYSIMTMKVLKTLEKKVAHNILLHFDGLEFISEE